MKFKSKSIQILFMHQREQTLSHPNVFLSDSYHAAALDCSQGALFVYRKDTLEHTQSEYFLSDSGVYRERTDCLQVLISVRTSSLILIKMFKLDDHRSRMLTVLCTEFPFILIQMFYHKG